MADKARKYLQNVLRYRKEDLPSRNTSLILLPAARDLRAEVRLLIRDIIRVERCNFPPLHLPSDKLILKKGQPFIDTAGVQLQTVHEELGQVHLHQFSRKVQEHRHHFRTPDVRSCRRHSAFLFSHGEPRQHHLLFRQQVARSYSKDFAKLVQTLEASISGIDTTTKVGGSAMGTAPTSSANIRSCITGAQGRGSGHPTPSCFSTRAGGSFSQLFVHGMSSPLSQAVMQNVRRSSGVPALQERYSQDCSECTTGL